jgi:hypothetical protein
VPQSAGRLCAWRLAEELEKTQASLQRRDVVAWLISHDFFRSKNGSPNYAMKLDFAQIQLLPPSQPTELFHRLLDRFHLLNLGIHGMFLEIHLLGKF